MSRFDDQVLHWSREAKLDVARRVKVMSRAIECAEQYRELELDKGVCRVNQKVIDELHTAQHKCHMEQVKKFDRKGLHHVTKDEMHDKSVFKMTARQALNMALHHTDKLIELKHVIPEEMHDTSEFHLTDRQKLMYGLRHNKEHHELHHVDAADQHDASEFRMTNRQALMMAVRHAEEIQTLIKVDAELINDHSEFKMTARQKLQMAIRHAKDHALVALQKVDEKDIHDRSKMKLSKKDVLTFALGHCEAIDQEHRWADPAESPTRHVPQEETGEAKQAAARKARFLAQKRLANAQAEARLRCEARKKRLGHDDEVTDDEQATQAKRSQLHAIVKQAEQIHALASAVHHDDQDDDISEITRLSRQIHLLEGCTDAHLDRALVEAKDISEHMQDRMEEAKKKCEEEEPDLSPKSQRNAQEAERLVQAHRHLQCLTVIQQHLMTEEEEAAHEAAEDEWGDGTNAAAAQEMEKVQYIGLNMLLEAEAAEGDDAARLPSTSLRSQKSTGSQGAGAALPDGSIRQNAVDTALPESMRASGSRRGPPVASMRTQAAATSVPESVHGAPATTTTAMPPPPGADYPPDGLSDNVRKLPEWIQLGCGDKPYDCAEKYATFGVDGECPEEMPELMKHQNFMAEELCRSPSLWGMLKDRRTSGGVTFAQCIKTGVDNVGHPHIKTVGMTAGDEESYEVFKELFDPVIDKRHGGYPPDAVHPTNLDLEQLSKTDTDPFNKYVLTSRVRTGRSVRGFKLPPVIGFQERRELEALCVEALLTMEGDLKGDYYPLHGSRSYAPKPNGMPEEKEEELRKVGNLFQEPDSTLLLASGMGRHWPDARGIFHNEAGNLFVWLNEEDHLRIVSMQGSRAVPTAAGKDIREVTARFIRACDVVQDVLRKKGRDFMHNDHLGWVLTCPSNLGTGLRAGCMVTLELLSQMPQFKQLLKVMRLQSRGTAGVDSASSGGTWDISNSDRIGKGEVDLVNALIEGMANLTRWEDMLEKGGEASDEAVQEIMANLE